MTRKIRHVTQVKEMRQILDREIETQHVRNVSFLTVRATREQVIAFHHIAREAIVQVATANRTLPTGARLEYRRRLIAETYRGVDLQIAIGMAGIRGLSLLQHRGRREAPSPINESISRHRV